MRIVFLTTDDPLYLPHFFDRVLASRGGETALVAIVPPLYAGQTTWQAVRRYYRTFGAADTVQLARRVVAAKAARRSVASVCARHDVASGPRPDVNAPAFLDELRSLGTDLIVSVSCPQLFRKPLIELPERGCLNVHGAVLPQYRGIMPSFWMLANGEKNAGVSIFFVNEDIDGGDLCGQRIFEISEHETLDEFLRRSKAVAADLLLDVLGDIDNGSVSRRPLEIGKGSYFSWPGREDVRRFRAAGRRVW